MRRFVMVALVGFVVLIVTHSAAFAFQSSLTANPANLPLLVESGMIAPGVTATGASATSTALVTSGSTAVGSFVSGGVKALPLLGAGVEAVDFLLSPDAELPDGTPGGAGVDPIYVGAWEWLGGPDQSGPDGAWMMRARMSGDVLVSTYAQGWIYCAIPGVDRPVTRVADPDAVIGYSVGGTGGRVNLLGGASNRGSFDSGSRVAVLERVTGACGPGEIPDVLSVAGGSVYDGCGSAECDANVRSFYRVREAASASPERYLETTITCRDPSGVETTITGNGVNGAGELLTTAGIMCPDGTWMSKIRNVLKTVGGPDVDLGSSDNPADLAQVPAGCWLAGVSCVLRYQREQNGTWVDLQPDALAEVQSEPWRWRCRMGSGETWQVVPTAWCESTIPNAAGPGVLTPVVTQPGYSSDFCNFGIADLLNPGSIFKAAGCAIRWAFVPEGDVLGSAFSMMSAGFWQSGPGEWLGGMRDALMRFPDGLGSAAGGCEGPAWDLRWGERSGDVTHLAPLSACAEPFSTVAGWVKPIAGAFLALGGVLACVRLISGSFGAPAPSEGD